MINFKFEVIPIEKLRPDAENCRLHDRENIEFIKASLSQYGFQKNIVVSKNFEIYAGNGTYLACKELGITEIPCAISNLPLDKLRAYAIADNQIPLSATWDLPKLSNQIQNLAVWDKNRDWKSLGFNENELKLMLSFDEQFLPQSNENDFKKSGDKPEDSNLTQTKVKMKPLKVSEDQYDIIKQAIEKIRKQENDPSISEGRALELICADYIS